MHAADALLRYTSLLFKTDTAATNTIRGQQTGYIGCCVYSIRISHDANFMELYCILHILYLIWELCTIPHVYIRTS